MLIPGGYVLKPRCIIDSDIASAPPHIRELWDLIIREANHKDAKYRGFHISRGQLFRTYSDLREKLHWTVGWRKMMYSENHMKKGMKYLRDRGMIVTKRELGGVLITICNYDLYQTPQNYESTKESTDERTIEEPLKNYPRTIYNKKEKNNKNSIKKKYMSEIKDSDNLNEYLKIAYEFWKLFKKQINKCNVNEPSVEKAICNEWSEPIRLLIEKENKIPEDFKSIYQYLSTNEFWEAKVFNMQQFREKNKHGIKYFDYFLLQQRKNEKANSISNIEDCELILKKYFKRTTTHLLGRFSDYQTMLNENYSKVLNGKSLDFEINKLAKCSGKDLTVAVNILNKSVSNKIEITKM